MVAKGQIATVFAHACSDRGVACNRLEVTNLAGVAYQVDIACGQVVGKDVICPSEGIRKRCARVAQLCGIGVGKDHPLSVAGGVRQIGCTRTRRGYRGVAHSAAVIDQAGLPVAHVEGKNIGGPLVGVTKGCAAVAKRSRVGIGKYQVVSIAGEPVDGAGRSGSGLAVASDAVVGCELQCSRAELVHHDVIGSARIVRETGTAVAELGRIGCRKCNVLAIVAQAQRVNACRVGRIKVRAIGQRGVMAHHRQGAREVVVRK